MRSITRFESRTAKVNYSPEVVFNFATDLRNFRRFIPAGSFSDTDFKRDSCSFRVNTLGTVSFQLSDKVKFNKIVLSGNALMQNDFSIFIYLGESEGSSSEIRLTLEAEMNPMLKMIASEPVRQFLDILVNQMEKFEGWNDIREDNQPL